MIEGQGYLSMANGEVEGSFPNDCSDTQLFQDEAMRRPQPEATLPCTRFTVPPSYGTQANPLSTATLVVLL